MLNSVTMMGRLVANPEKRSTRDGKFMTTFSIAVARNYDRDTSDFFDCIAFGKGALFVHDYFSRGQMILVQGTLQTSKWVDKNGTNRKDFKIIVDHSYFADSKSSGRHDDTQDNAYPTASDYTDVTDTDEGEIPF